MSQLLYKIFSMRRSNVLIFYRFEKISSTPNWAKLPSERDKHSDGKNTTVFSPFSSPELKTL